MPNTKWTKELNTPANDGESNMPLARGLRRQAMIARRLETDRPAAKVTLPPLPAFMSTDISI